MPDYVAALRPDRSRDLSGLHGGLRVGVPREYFVEGMQPEVEAAVRRAIGVLAELGAEVREISLPHTDLALPVYYLIAPAEASANLARYDGIRYGLSVPGETLWDGYRKTRGQGFGPEVKRRIMLGTYALSAGYYDAYYLKAQQVRTLIRQDFERTFRAGGCDRLPDDADHRLSHRREGRRSAEHVPVGHLHPVGEPGRHLRPVAAVRLRRLPACRSACN